MTDQLSLLEWGAGNPQEATPDLPKAIAQPQPAIAHQFQIGDVVTVKGLQWAGQVVGFADDIGMVQVEIGLSGPYTCGEHRLTAYTGVISLWRLGSATCCERPGCQPHQSARPFDCSICGDLSQPYWWYVGEMSTEARSPHWPDAMWFPANYDPNTKEQM
jgi:hypothetical protein